MANPITINPPVFPVNTQQQNPISPDWDCDFFDLSILPSWLDGSSKTQGFLGSTYANLILGLDSQLETLRNRAINFSITDPTQWAAIASESPYWVIDTDKSQLFNSSTEFINFASNAVGVIPFIKTQDLQLTSPGILVTTSNPSSGYFINLPDDYISRDDFWNNGYSPKVIQTNNNIYLKDLDRATLDFTNAKVSPSGTAYLPYLGDKFSINYGYTTASGYQGFDIPLSDTTDGFHPLYFKRGSDAEIFKFSGTNRIVDSWTTYASSGLLQGIVLPTLHTGDNASVSYISQGKHSLLFGDSIVLFQGDSRYNNLYGFAVGPLYPVDSTDIENLSWGIPSRPYLSQYPYTLKKIRKSETHNERINRLLFIEKVKGLSNNSRNTIFRLSALFGRLNGIVITGTTVVSGDAIFTGMDGYQEKLISFDRTDSNTKYIRQVTQLSNYPALISPESLMRRYPGINYGGYTVTTPANTKFSPFSRTSIVSNLTDILPTPTTNTWEVDNPITGQYSNSISDISLRNKIDITVSHPNYIAKRTTTEIVPGTVDNNSLNEAIVTTTNMNVISLQDAYIRGDINLRGPDRPTKTWLAITSSTNQSTPWNKPYTSKKPVTSSAPFDLDINLVPPVVNAPIYGTGPNTPTLSYSHPLSGDYS